MASFTSTLLSPPLLNSMRSPQPSQSIPTPAARLHFPDFPKLCFISKGSTVKAKSQRGQPEAKYLFHINQASVALLNDCFFVHGLGGSRARPGQSTSSVQRFFHLLAAGNAPLLAFQNHRPICHRGQPCLGKLISLPLPLCPAAYQFLTPTGLLNPRTEAKALDQE